MHTEKISETMRPQSEAHNFVLCFLGSTNDNKKKKALCGISAGAGFLAPSSFGSPHAWLRQETCGNGHKYRIKKEKKNTQRGQIECLHPCEEAKGHGG